MTFYHLQIVSAEHRVVFLFVECLITGFLLFFRPRRTRPPTKRSYSGRDQERLLVSKTPLTKQPREVESPTTTSSGRDQDRPLVSKLF